MPHSNNIGSYEDIRRVLDAGLAAGGIRVTFPSGNRATHWCHRAYHLRKLLYKLKEKEMELFVGAVPSTPYDTMRLTREGANREIVVVNFEPVGYEATDLNGKPLELKKVAAPADDLANAAATFAEGLE